MIRLLLRLRLINVRSIAAQLCKPSGLLGILIGRTMEKWNKQAIQWTIDQLDIKQNDRVLEIGYGPGIGLEMAAKKASSEAIAGIDFSQQMYAKASKRNQEVIHDGHMDLRVGDAQQLPWKDASFDKVFAVNVVYFFTELNQFLSEIKRVLVAGGTVALFLLERKSFWQEVLTTGIFHPRTQEQMKQELQKAGFSKIDIISGKSAMEGECFCMVARK